MTKTTRTDDRSKAIVKAAAVFIFLSSLGFPGNLTEIFGSGITTLTDYTSFFLQFALMLFFGGEAFLEIRLINLKSRYWTIYLMLFVWFVTSMAVTQNRHDEFITCFRVTVLGLYSLWLCDHFEPHELIRLFLWALGLYSGAALMFAIVRPGSAFVTQIVSHAFAGLLGKKNPQATMYAVGILLQLVLFRISQLRREQVSNLFLLGLAGQIILLFMCRSTGAVITMLIPSAYILIFEKPWGRDVRLPLGWIYIIFSLGFLVFALTAMQGLEPLFELLGKDASLTGRVPLWRRLIEVMNTSHTWTGYGYGMFWRDTRAVELVQEGFDRYSWLGNISTGSHNVIMELWLNVGFIGIFMFFQTLVVCTRRIKEVERQRYIFTAGYMILFMLHGLTERSFGQNDYMTMLFFIAMGYAAQREDKFSDLAQRMIEKRKAYEEKANREAQAPEQHAELTGLPEGS